MPSLSNRVEKSDVVVIGRFEKTEDTGKTNSVGLQKIEVLEVQSVFRIEAVLKGTVSTNSLSLKHYRRPPTSSPFDEVTVTVGPQYSFVTFAKSMNSATAYFDDLYLIFLKQRTNGMLVPVTGTTDPKWSFLNIEQNWGSKAEPSAGTLPRDPHVDHSKVHP